MKTTTADIAVLPVPNGGWRVSDNNIDERDARGLLGFIDHIDGRFETTVLGSPREHRSFGAIGDAVDFLATHRTPV